MNFGIIESRQAGGARHANLIQIDPKGVIRKLTITLFIEMTYLFGSKGAPIISIMAQEVASKIAGHKVLLYSLTFSSTNLQSCVITHAQA